jgi:branched-chain amino acid transport system substrate-binding protein
VNLVARIVLFASVVIGLAACPHGTRKTLVPEVPTSGNAQARSRFTDAKQRFEANQANAAEFKAIAQDFPTDPIRPYADLYAGIAAVHERKYAEAETSLTAAQSAGVEGLDVKAALYLGIVANYRGDHARALTLLKKGEAAVENDADRTEYLAALAYSVAESDQPLSALRVFDDLYPRVTPPEKALIVSRVAELVAAADPKALASVFDKLSDRKGPSTALAASRLALLADAAGDSKEAERMRDVAKPARVAVGLPVSLSAAASGPVTSPSSSVVGAVLPLGGKQNKVAEAAVAGLGLAAGVTEGKGAAAVEVRSAQDAESSAAAVEELAKANVIAVVGPIDSASVDAAGQRADSLGVPLLSLSTAAEKNAGGKMVFHMVHSGEARSRALARAALAKGVKKFAVLASEGGYGRAMTAAFTSELTKGGGSIITTVTYKADTKSFAPIVGKITGDWEGIFVPAQADTLSLITPALAASGRVPKPVGTNAKKMKDGRPILLVSTAENLTAAYVVAAGRHTEGALLAPGYFPDDHDAASKAFLDRFVAAFGRAPGFLEAYAYDATVLAAAAGASGRAGLAATLSTGQLVGLTGTIRFDADHRRADAGVIYTVVEEQGSYAIRIAK